MEPVPVCMAVQARSRERSIGARRHDLDCGCPVARCLTWAVLSASSSRWYLERLNGQHRVQLEVDRILDELFDLVSLERRGYELHRFHRGHRRVGEILVRRL